jgi:hypothetical protein
MMSQAQNIEGFFNTIVHKTPWAFTTVEAIHVFALAMVLGTILIMDGAHCSRRDQHDRFRIITIRVWNNGTLPTLLEPARLAGGTSDRLLNISPHLWSSDRFHVADTSPERRKSYRNIKMRRYIF